MTFWQQYAYIGTLCGLGLFLWYVMNLPITKTQIRNWFKRLKTEILPEEKRQRKELYHRFMLRFYPEYEKIKEDEKMNQEKIKIEQKKQIKKNSQKRGRYWMIGLIILIATLVLTSSFPQTKASDDFMFNSENVIKGISNNQANRNAEDETFQTLTEANQYSDTYFSGSSEVMTYGTTNGGPFPSALDTDDATRRNYIESNINPAGYIQFLNPVTPDAQAQWDVVFPASPTTHFDKLDDTGTNTLGDSDTTYINTATVTDQDRFNMGDMTTPQTGYLITVTEYLVHKKIATPTCNIQAGIRIGTVNYGGISINPTNGVWTNTSSNVWNTNPAGGAWTYTAVNALITYLATSDIAPVPYATKLVLKIIVTYPTADYEMQGTLTYSNVLSTSQTTGFSVLCQGYRSNSENFYIQAWDYTTTTWNTKITINSASDTDFNFDLTGWSTNHERSSGNEVKLRLIDVTGSDTIQDTLYLDLLKIKRTEVGYALEVEMTASATNTYGNQQLYIKGKTSAETFNIAVYNWETTSWETNKISITSISNTVYTYTLTAAQRSGTQEVKIQFIDGTSYTADQVQDILSLDYVCIKWIHSDPTITLYRTSIVEINIGENAVFWLTYTDIDNEAPSYVYTHISSTDYSMSANDSDTIYYDGKLYGLTKSDLIAGNTTYYFKVKDTNSGDITTSPVALSVNTKPTLTLDGVIPETGIPQTFTFFVTYYDTDSNTPQYVKAIISGVDYDMVYNGSNGNYHYDKSISVGDTEYSFKTADYRSGLIQTTPKHLIVYPADELPTLTNNDRTPTDPVYKNIQLNFTITYTDLDNDTPTSIKWREDNGTTQNITMSEINNSDTNYVDGKNYYTLIYLEHGIHWYDYFASNSFATISTNDYTITISNRNPIITSSGNTTQLENTFLCYSIIASDPDEDSLTYQLSTNASWASISLNFINGTAINIGWYHFTIWVNDSYSGTTYELWFLNVTEIFNYPPYFTSSPIITGQNITWYIYIVTTSDPENDELIFNFGTMNASFLSINSSSGLITGTPTHEGNYSVTISVTDGTSIVWQNYSLNISVYSPVSEINLNLLGIIGITIGMIISIGIFAITKKRK